MDKKPKPSNYHMLQDLDKHVQSDRSRKGSDARFTNVHRRKRSRSVSPRNRDNYKKKSSGSSGYNDDSKKKKYEEIVLDSIDYDIPDRSFGDLYCKACDSHMNSDQMWEAHIQGKRHQKHIKTGDPERKYDVLSEDAIFQKEIKDSKEHIIGLQHCCEIQRPEGKPIYQCFLCSATVPNSQQLIDHVIGLKHRMAYLKDHDPAKHQLISKANIKKGMIEPVVEECIQMHFNKYGPGRMQVKVERPKPPGSPYQSYKKHFSDVHDNRKKRIERKKSYEKADSRYESSSYRAVSEKDWDYPPPRSDPYEDDYYYAPDTTYDKKQHYDDRNSRYDRDDSDYRLRPLTPPISEPSYAKNYTDLKDKQKPRIAHDLLMTHAPYNHQSPDQHRIAYDQPRIQAPYDQQISQSGLVQHHSSSRTQPVTQEDPGTVDLRAFLVKRRMQDFNKTQISPITSLQASKENHFESLLNIIEALPTISFLELVLQRVENLNPTDNELELVQKIGNYMISIVMGKKLAKLSPDMLNKYQQSVGSSVVGSGVVGSGVVGSSVVGSSVVGSSVVGSSVVGSNVVATTPAVTRTTDTSNKSSNLNSLMGMISYFKTSPSDTSRQQEYYQSDAANNQLRGSDAAYMTQSAGKFFNSSYTASSQSITIPGLTLSGTNENQLLDQSSFLQNQQGSSNSQSRSNNWVDQYNRY